MSSLLVLWSSRPLVSGARARPIDLHLNQRGVFLVGAVERAVRRADRVFTHLLSHIQGAVRAYYSDDLLVRELRPLGEVALSTDGASHSGRVCALVEGIWAKWGGLPRQESFYPGGSIEAQERRFAVFGGSWRCDSERHVFLS